MLKPPAWAPDAKPINRGWIHHLTGELLVSRKHSDREIEEYYIAKADVASPPHDPAPAPEPTPEPIIEADPEPEVEATAEVLTEVVYEDMTKATLAEYAETTHGITLDTTMTKANMIESLKSQI